MAQDEEPRRLKLLLHRLSEWVEPHIIERGRDYYEFDHVLRVQIEGDIIHAIVQGSQGSYSTKIHLADFGRSECDCPYDDYCKHMVAVVYAAVQHDKATVDDDKPAPTAGSVMSLLSTLSHEDLLEVIDLALREKPKLAEHISLWFDRFQTRQDMKRVLVGMDTPEAIQYFESRVATVVMEAEQMFESNLVDDGDEEYDSWGNPVYSVDTWHCDEGIAHVRHWCDTLLAALTDETVISVVVGLALTVSRVASWPKLYPNEAERELSDALDWCSNGLQEAVVRLQSALVRTPRLRQEYILFTDWITDCCKNMGYLVDWTEVLSSCILDSEHLLRVHEKLCANNPAFLLSEELLNQNGTGIKEYNGYGCYLVDWWCRLCLLHGNVQEAEEALQSSGTETGPIAGITTIRMLASHFVGNGNRHKAAHYTDLAVRMNPRANAKDYEWVSEMYESLQMMPESVQARKQAFLSWPTWERFEQWLRDVPSLEERQGKVREWASALVCKGEIGLPCRMLWTVGLVEEAWHVVSEHRIAMHTIDDDLTEFLKRFETYDVERAITVYQDIAIAFIHARQRSSYRQATVWLRAIREAWMSANQQDAWRLYFRAFQEEHRRLPALQDELKVAGLM